MSIYVASERWGGEEGRGLLHMRVYCIAIHHSFVPIKLSTLALSFLPSPFSLSPSGLSTLQIHIENH